MIRSQNRQFLPYIISLCAIYLCGMGWGGVVFGQCPFPSQFGPQWVDGSFSIAGTEVGTQCTGRAVQVTTPANVTKARYIYDYKSKADTSKATPQTSFTYTQPGSYAIVQMGVINGKPSLWCNSVQVYSSSKPTFTLSDGCGNSTKLMINTTGLAFGQYLIDWGDGKPAQLFAPGQPSPTYTYTGPGAYQIKVTGEGTLALAGCKAVSDPQTFEVLQDPVSITNAVTTVVDNIYGKITITLPNTVKTKNYSFNRNGSEILRISNTLIDSTTNTSQGSVCYQVSYTDICDRRPTNQPTVCTIYLEVDGETLKWTSQSPFISAVATYTIEKIGDNGQVLATYPNNNAAEWPIDINDNDPTVIYRVRATSTDGQSSISNTIVYARVPKLFVPDTFSPNNDSVNDTFEIKGQAITIGQITIYDRWGNVLYSTDSWTKAWDGSDANGRKVTQGAYTYRIDYTDVQNKSYSKLGTVYLVR
ncbi:gliding motility-associated C-terminal domain-containing protein [Runella sp.]|uniref:T9SS type B sorting domain-containing protein n=1 Tax=Runella sp. TaxID=1960881 RepID=UPI003D14F26B